MKGILRKLLVSHFIVFAVPLAAFAVFGLLAITQSIRRPFETACRTQLAELKKQLDDEIKMKKPFNEALEVLRPAVERSKYFQVEIVWVNRTEIPEEEIDSILEGAYLLPEGADVSATRYKVGFRTGGEGWPDDAVIVISAPAGTLLGEISTIQRNILLTIMVAFLFSAYIALLFARSMSRPVQNLTGYAEQVAAGKDAEPPTVKTGDEIQTLAEAFGRMTTKLQERMDYIKDFARMLSHELKTPLTSIIGASEILSDGAKDDPEAREKFISNIATESEHLKNMVEDTLVLARLESESIPFEFTPGDFNEFVKTVVDSNLHRAEEKGVDLAFEPGDGTGKANFDSWRMEQVIGNLITNAIRFTPSDGKITVTTKRNAGRIILSVRDTGAGIEAEDLPHVFDRFFTRPAPDEEDHKGTGLGLAIARGIIEGHDGTITADGKPGEGAVFTVDIPGI